MKINKYILAFLVCVIFLGIVQYLFSTPAKSKYFQAVWSAGDLISFVGAIVLGIVAISQTRKANDMSERLMQIEENRYKLEVRPFVVITDYQMFKKSIRTTSILGEEVFVEVCDGLFHYKTCFELTMTNTTQAYLSITYNGAAYLDSAEELNWGMKYHDPKNKTIRLYPNESKKITFFGDSEKMFQTLQDKKIQFSFKLENRFAEKYVENIDCIIVTRQDSTQSSYIAVESFNYHIGKCGFDKNGNPIIIWEDVPNGQP